jgi:enoyl-CoA hydratase
MTDVTLSVHDGRATLTLVPDVERRPPVIDLSMLDRLEAALAAVQRTLGGPGSARVAIVRSASSRSFCAGASIDALESLDRSTIDRWVERGHEVFLRLERLPLPTIAVIAGHAFGGGLELALACDLIFATESAQFAQPETRLGFVTGWGGGRRLAERVGTARARELAYTGRTVGAEEAVAMGLVQYAGSVADVEERLERTVRDIAEGSAVAVAAMKEIAGAADPGAAERSLELERRHSREVIGDPETVRRVGEFLARRRR